jgi:hypothetical protein
MDEFNLHGLQKHLRLLRQSVVLRRQNDTAHVGDWWIPGPHAASHFVTTARDSG